MSLLNSTQESPCTKQDLENWLEEVSSFEGKCCYVNKKSMLRSKLVSKLNLLNLKEAEIVKIFDENLWKQEGKIYEIHPGALKELQDKISTNLPFHRIKNHENINLKNEFLNFALNQSTLLALFISAIIFSRAIFKIFNTVIGLEIGLSLLYFLTLFIVISIIDQSGKFLWRAIGGVVVILHLVVYLLYFPHSASNEYIGILDIVKIGLFFFFNMILLGTALFSSLFSISKFADKKENYSKTVYMILAVFIYAFFIVVFIQGINTITLS